MCAPLTYIILQEVQEITWMLTPWYERERNGNIDSALFNTTSKYRADARW